MSDHAHGSADEHEHHSHGKTYFLVFCALCVFTLISVAADLVKLPKPIQIPVILAVAVAKALSVMMYFMHLKFERAWKYLLLGPTIILACTIPMALMPDIGSHYYTTDYPQHHEYQRQLASGGGHGHGGHDSDEHGAKKDH